VLLSFLAEEPEMEAKTDDVDKWNECETMQKLSSSEEQDLNSFSFSSTIDSEGNRYYWAHSMGP